MWLHSPSARMRESNDSYTTKEQGGKITEDRITPFKNGVLGESWMK